MGKEAKIYLDKLQDIFFSNPNFKIYSQAINNGNSSFKIQQKYLKKFFDSDWIDIIDEVLPSLDAIVRNPRRFISIEEDIIDISLAKQISVESVKHLAQHTQFISSVDLENQSITPSKILNTSKEESFEVYENRFIYTLLLKLNDFVDKRFDAIKKSVINHDKEITILINSNYTYQGNKFNFKLESSTNIPYKEEDFVESSDYLTFQRVEKIRNIIKGFLSSSFSKEMKNSSLVRPPITRTNVIKKEPNFKKALVLWQFIESYEKNGFETSLVNETNNLSDELNEQYQQLLFVNNLIMNSLNTLEENRNLEFVNKEDQPNINLKQQIEKYPYINFDLKEVRKVYQKQLGDKVYSPSQYRSLINAIDRVINQYKIRKLNLDKEEKQKLIVKQKKEEQKNKLLRIKELKLEEQRRKKEEEIAIKLLEKEEKAKIRLEKEEILKQKRLIKERQKRMIDNLLAQELINQKIDDYRNKLELKLKKRLEDYQSEQSLLFDIDSKNLELEINNEIEEYKKSQVENFKKMLDQKLENISLKDYEKIK